jgi:hypothetical protein
LDGEMLGLLDGEMLGLLDGEMLGLLDGEMLGLLDGEMLGLFDILGYLLDRIDTGDLEVTGDDFIDGLGKASRGDPNDAIGEARRLGEAIGRTDGRIVAVGVKETPASAVLIFGKSEVGAVLFGVASSTFSPPMISCNFAAMSARCSFE